MNGNRGHTLIALRVCPLFLIFLLSVISIAQAATKEDACADLNKNKSYYTQETEHSRQQLAVLYNNCGVQYMNQKKWTTAIPYLQRAREIDPKNPNYGKYIGQALAERGDEYFKANEVTKARDDFEKALRYDPTNGDIKLALSQAIYRVDSKSDRVSELLEEGASQKSDAGWKKKVDSTKSLVDLEKNSREERKGNLTLRIQEGIKVDPEEVFKIIEKASNRIGEDFNHWIKNRVIFVLTDEAHYQKIHGGPGWAGALNDGRIKVPVGGTYQDPKNFREVLAHEYTHSVINDLTYGHHAAFWIHEGLARYEEYKEAGEDPADISHFPMLFITMQAGQTIPMKTLSQADASEHLDTMQAGLAYEQALSFIVYVEEIYQFHSILSMIKEIGKGKPIEEAVVEGIGRNIDFLEDEWKAWFRQKYLLKTPQ